MGDGRSLSSASGSSSSSTLFNEPSGMSISSLQSSPHKSAAYHSLTSNSSTLKPMAEHPAVEYSRHPAASAADYSGTLRNAVHSHLFPRADSPGAGEEQPTSVSESLTEDLVPVRQHASALQDLLESDHTVTPSVSPTLHSTAVCAEPHSEQVRLSGGGISPQRSSPGHAFQQPSVHTSRHVSPYMSLGTSPYPSQRTSPYPSAQTSQRSSPHTSTVTEVARISPVLPSSQLITEGVKETSRPDTSSHLLAELSQQQSGCLSDTGISLGGAADSTLTKSATTPVAISHRPPASPRSLSPCSRRTAGSPPVRPLSSCGYKSTQKSTASQATKSDVSTNTAPLTDSRYLPVTQQTGAPARDVTAADDTLTAADGTLTAASNKSQSHTSPVMAGAVSMTCPYTPGCGSVVYPVTPGGVTPGRPVCESSHIQQQRRGAGGNSPSERGSTQYHSITAAERTGGGAEISQRPDDTTWYR